MNNKGNNRILPIQFHCAVCIYGACLKWKTLGTRLVSPAFPMGSFPFAMRSTISSRCLLLHTTLCVTARVPGGFLPMFPLNLICAILCICWSVTARIPCVYPRECSIPFALAFSMHRVCVLLHSCTFFNAFHPVRYTMDSILFSRALLRASPYISSLVFPMHSPIIPSHFATNFPCIPLYEVSPLGFLLVSPSITCGFPIR